MLEVASTYPGPTPMSNPDPRPNVAHAGQGRTLPPNPKPELNMGMLQVGRVSEPAPNTSYSWNRAHFGAWCVVSAPLILGMELTDAELSPVMDIIGNQEAEP